MKFKPVYYKTHPCSLIVRLESVIKTDGTLCFAVTLSNGDKDNEHYIFNHLSSAIDFIDNNFQA